MKLIAHLSVALFLLTLATGLQAQSMQFQDIFQSNLNGTFRGLNLGMTIAEVNNVTSIPSDQLERPGNVPFKFPISRYGKDGDTMEGFFTFSRDKTLKEILVRIALVDALNYSDIETEIREYLDYEFGTGNRWGTATRWQMGSMRIVLEAEETGSGGMLTLKFQGS